MLTDAAEGSVAAATSTPATRLFDAVGCEAFVFAGDPAWNIHFVPLREAVFTGTTGQIRPGFVRAHVGDEVVRGGEGGFARGGGHQVALERCRMATWHGDRAGPEA